MSAREPAPAYGWWPQLRAALIFVHVAAVLVLSLPSAHRLNNKAVWNSRVNRDEMAAWANLANRLGIELTPERFAERLWDFTQDYLTVRARLAAPFSRYVRVSGLSQGWRMFANPQRHPAQLHVDVGSADALRPVFIARDPEHDWRRHQFDHNRMRKLVGRFGRNINRVRYRQLASWIARELARDFPDASHGRVRLLRFRSRTPAQVRAGEPVGGEFTDVRLFELEAFR